MNLLFDSLFVQHVDRTPGYDTLFHRKRVATKTSDVQTSAMRLVHSVQTPHLEKYPRISID